MKKNEGAKDNIYSMGMKILIFFYTRIFFCISKYLEHAVIKFHTKFPA